ncbi:MAG: PspA-associated protein PspAA [Ardenticatenaceae bacterium]
MIVRISTEGQYRLSSALLDEVNEMDNALVGRIAECEEDEFRERFSAILDLVRDRGEKLPDDELVESHFILPRPDITLEEARDFFTGEGLFPDEQLT